ncbi:MAG: hypothetical protein Q4G67_04835 [Actinomycetia bacterium]|nr:hypothetical protein [Actinomycetes bacterium]
MSASPVLVPFYRAVFAERAAGWELADALDSTLPTVAVERVREWMATVDVADLDAGEQIDLITHLEQIKSAAAAAQARLTAAFAADKVTEALGAHRAQADAAGFEPVSNEAASRRRAQEETDLVAKTTRSVGS